MVVIVVMIVMWTCHVDVVHTRILQAVFVLGTFTSMPEHPSVSKIVISSFGLILLPGIFLRSRRPFVEFVGLSTSPQSVQNIPSYFRLALFEGIARCSGFLRNL